MPKKNEIIFLGSGSSFCLSKENYQSNIAIKAENGKILLFDAGSTINDALDNAKINVNDINSIFISHLHSDHIGGLEFIALKRYFDKFPFGENPATLISSKRILKNLWKNSLKGGLAYVEGEKKTLDSYFKIQKLDKDNLSFNFENLEIEPVSTLHVHEVENENIQSYGLLIKGKKTVFITGDVQFDKNLNRFYEKADIIFQDCEFAKYPRSIHAQFHELCELPLEVRKKMFLYHYSLEIKDNDDKKSNSNKFKSPIYEDFKVREKTVKDAGFAGLVKRGRKFIF